MLNKSHLSTNCFSKASISLIIFVLLINLSCGKRKPPQPPVERIVQRVGISGIQRGNLVLISWNLPSQSASEQKSASVVRADIYRLAEPLNTSLELSEEEFASRSTLISSLPISDEDFRSQRVVFTDILEFAGQNARLRYAIRFVNAAGQKAAFSNFLLIESTAKVATNPTLIAAEISEEQILLMWEAPTKNIDGSVPANIIGFNVYRMDNEKAATLLNVNSPVTQNKYADRLFEFGKDYRYYIRALSLGRNGEPVESLNSNVIEAKPKDVFPPSQPSAITIAAAPNNLSIFFAVNPERDIAGYRIYRSINRAQPLSDWQLLTSDLLTTNTFQDTGIESGKRYFYYLTAVDKTGNTSEPSLIVSETAP